jgi:arginine N-succinyltransferase
LQNEGFSYQFYIDIFDAGPTLMTPIKYIKTIQSAQTVFIESIKSHDETKKSLIANQYFDFRACIDNINYLGNNEVVISPKTAEKLEVKIGDSLTVINLSS